MDTTFGQAFILELSKKHDGLRGVLPLNDQIVLYNNLDYIVARSLRNSLKKMTSLYIAEHDATKCAYPLSKCSSASVTQYWKSRDLKLEELDSSYACH